MSGLPKKHNRKWDWRSERLTRLTCCLALLLSLGLSVTIALLLLKHDGTAVGPVFCGNISQDLQDVENLFNDSFPNITMTSTTPSNRASDDKVNIRQSSLEQEHYKKLVKEAFEEVLKMLHSESTLLTTNDHGDTIVTLNYPKYGNIYLLTSKLNVPCEALHRDQWENGDKVDEWNPTLLQMDLVEEITENLKIFHQVTAPGAGNMVSSRDFINLSFSTLFKSKYFMVYQSIEYDGIPESSDYVRAWNYPSAQIMSPLPGQPEWCTFQWLMNVDFKFNMFLSSLESQIMKFVLSDYITYLRKHVPDITL